MSTQFLHLLLFLFLLLVLIAITEMLHRVFRFSTESTRKFLHVSGGLMCLLFPWFFNSHWWLLPLAILSFLLLWITYKRKWLPSIHQTRRQSIGSVLFPIPVYGCFLLAEIMHNNLFYFLPVCLLTVSDTAAEIGGHQWGAASRQFFGGQKTLAGSLSFLLTALILVFLILFFYGRWPVTDTIITGLALSIMATITELITLRGWDNLSVPAVVAAILLAHQAIVG